MAWSQCASCGETFTSLTGFDRHQDWDYKRRPMLICREPSSIGMIQRNNGMWSIPLDADSRNRVSKMRAETTPAGT